MVKTLVSYQCGICGREYNKMKDATECESKGIPKFPPVGLVFGNAKGFYKDITFCIAKVTREGHFVDTSLWACRDNGAGDSLGKNLCGGGSASYGEDWQKLESPSRSHPTFRRMIRYLKKNKIKPLMLQRGKAVSVKVSRRTKASARQEK